MENRLTAKAALLLVLIAVFLDLARVLARAARINCRSNSAFYIEMGGCTRRQEEDSVVMLPRSGNL